MSTEIDTRLLKRAIAWTDQLAAEHGVDGAVLHALGLISLQLEDLRSQGVFGKNGVKIRPYRLSTTPIKILEKDPSGRIRSIDIWVDSGVGGPTPTVRLGLGSVSASVGIRIDSGAKTELGAFDASSELFGVASTGLNIYVVERL